MFKNKRISLPWLYLFLIISIIGGIVTTHKVWGGERVMDPHSKEACLFCHVESEAGGKQDERPKFITGKDRSHFLIRNFCQTCHKGESFDFWMIVFKKKRAQEKKITKEKTPVDKKIAPVSEKKDSPKIANSFKPVEKSKKKKISNPHIKGECLDCHSKKPVKGVDTRKTIKLRVLDNNEITLCNQCHQDKSCHPVGIDLSNLDLARNALKKINLDLQERIVCSTCHDIHFTTSKRERYGLYSNILSLCESCHSKLGNEHYKEVNPMIDKSVRGLISKLYLPLVSGKTNCLTCHGTGPKENNPFLLRQDFIKLAEKSTAINPHGKRTFCLSCHSKKPTSREVSFKFGGNFVTLCNWCHATIKKGFNIHPVNVTSKKGSWKMDFSGFPLAKDKVTCVTCHDERCREEIGANNANFLRGGPYTDATGFCINCHEQKKLGTKNPHRQLDRDGNIIEESCVFCHISKPDVFIDDVETVSFSEIPILICQRCHQVEDHPALAFHMVEPSERMVSRIKTYEQKFNIYFPLYKGRITCATCHNPHQRGVLKGNAGVGADENRRKRMPAHLLCEPCHEGGGVM